MTSQPPPNAAPLTPTLARILGALQIGPTLWAICNGGWMAAVEPRVMRLVPSPNGGTRYEITDPRADCAEAARQAWWWTQVCAAAGIALTAAIYLPDDPDGRASDELLPALADGSLPWSLRRHLTPYTGLWRLVLTREDPMTGRTESLPLDSGGAGYLAAIRAAGADPLPIVAACEAMRCRRHASRPRSIRGARLVLRGLPVGPHAAYDPDLDVVAAIQGSDVVEARATPADRARAYQLAAWARACEAIAHDPATPLELPRRDGGAARVWVRPVLAGSRAALELGCTASGARFVVPPDVDPWREAEALGADLRWIDDALDELAAATAV